jgi:hypothetical protein
MDEEDERCRQGASNTMGQASLRVCLQNSLTCYTVPENNDTVGPQGLEDRPDGTWTMGPPGPAMQVALCATMFDKEL